MPKVLIAAPVRQRPAVLAAFLQSLEWQQADADVEFLFIDDNTDPASKAILANFPTLTPLDRQPTAYEVNEQTHNWDKSSFQFLAREKQRLLDHAVTQGFDYIWLVDSDLLCDPLTLHSLLQVNQPIVSAVFWTQWTPDSPLLPQVWVTPPYELAGGRTHRVEQFLTRLVKRELLQVGGLGACTLISAEAIRAGVGFWPFLDNLPDHDMSQGEDRHFCEKARRLHIPLFADAWPDIAHIYRPSYDRHIPTLMHELQTLNLSAANIGDYIYYSIEDLQTPGLRDKPLIVRGRLGGLEILPEIESDLLDMQVGEECLTTLTFPDWYAPVPELQGQTRTFQIKLHGAKRYLPNISLSRVESSFRDRDIHPSDLHTLLHTQKASDHAKATTAPEDVNEIPPDSEKVEPVVSGNPAHNLDT